MEKKKLTKSERAVERFAEMMISTIEGLQQGWRKTWITTTANGRPMNANGRPYNRTNEFFLLLVGCSKGYDFPVYMTMRQCNALGARVTKGEKSWPVLFWSLYAKNLTTGECVDIKVYDAMSKAEKEGWRTMPALKSYDVFNVAQTNLKEANPEAYTKMVARYAIPELRSADGMYQNARLDALIGGEWLCPIKTMRQDKACYIPSKDEILLPEKEQFNQGGTAEEVYGAGYEFYSTALHEIAHSTGAEKRLNRIAKGDTFGSQSYGREELVAELTAAMCGHELGFNTAVEKNNAAYLSSWLKTLKEEPRYLVSVLADVNKAANMIIEAIDNVKIA